MMTIPKVTGDIIIPSGGLKKGLSPFVSPQLCPPPPNNITFHPRDRFVIICIPFDSKVLEGSEKNGLSSEVKPESRKSNSNPVTQGISYDLFYYTTELGLKW